MSYSKFLALTAVLSFAVMHGSEAYEVSNTMAVSSAIDSASKQTEKFHMNSDKSFVTVTNGYRGSGLPSANGSIDASAPVSAATNLSIYNLGSQGYFRSTSEDSSSSTAPSTLADSSMMLLAVIGLAMLQLRRKQRSLPQKPFR